MAQDVIGTVLNKTYRIDRKLAEGGMGAVYLATHVRLRNKRFAVKVLKGKPRRDATYERFRREAEIATQLGHPHIVEVLDFNEMPDGNPYLVMEYLEGETLSSRLRSGFPLNHDQIVAVLEQVASALQAAHEIGVVHRDIKPANIFLLGERDGPIQAKILDFGVSKIRDSTQALTLTNMLVGTFNYMSPEQAVGGSHEVDATSDLFALGTLSYALFTGRLPFAAEGPAKVLEKVLHHEPDFSILPATLRSVLIKALKKNKRERYQRAEDFITELKAAVQEARSSATLPPIATCPDEFMPITHAETASYGDEVHTRAKASAGAELAAADDLHQTVPDGSTALRPARSEADGRKTVPDGIAAKAGQVLEASERETILHADPTVDSAVVTRPEMSAVRGKERVGATSAPAAQVSGSTAGSATFVARRKPRVILIASAAIALVAVVLLVVVFAGSRGQKDVAAGIAAPAPDVGSGSSTPAKAGADAPKLKKGDKPAAKLRPALAPEVTKPATPKTQPAAAPKPAVKQHLVVKRPRPKHKRGRVKRPNAGKMKPRVKKKPRAGSDIKAPSFDKPRPLPTKVKRPPRTKKDETLGERIPGLDTAL